MKQNQFIYFDLLGKALNVSHIVRFEVVNDPTEGCFVGALMTDGYLLRVRRASDEEDAKVQICTFVKNLGGIADKEVSLNSSQF